MNLDMVVVMVHIIQVSASILESANLPCMKPLMIGEQRWRRKGKKITTVSTAILNVQNKYSSK